MRLDVVRGNGLPFLDTPPNERKSRAEIIRRLEINMTEHEAASLSVGDPLTLTGTAYFVRSRRDRKELPKDVLDAVTIRLDGAALGSTFGTIVISDAEVKVEKTGRTYLPGD